MDPGACKQPEIFISQNKLFAARLQGALNLVVFLGHELIDAAVLPVRCV